VQIIAHSPRSRPASGDAAGKDRGIDFAVKDDYLQQVRLAGGDDDLITALKSARGDGPPSTVDPAAQTRQAAVLQHVARGAELKRQGQYAQAEQEFRAALTPGAPTLILT